MTVGSPPELVGFTAEQSPFFDRVVAPEIGLMSYRVAGEVREEDLRCAAALLTDRYPSLRSRVSSTDGRVVQCTAVRNSGCALEVEPVESVKAAGQAAVRVILEPMDLENAGPMRILWHPIGLDDSILTIAIAHPWADAMAIDVVGRSFWEFHANVLAGLPVRVEPLIAESSSSSLQMAEIPDRALRHLQDQLLQVAAVVDRAGAVDRDPLRASYLWDEWDDGLVESVAGLAEATKSTVPIAMLALFALAIGDVVSIDELMVMTPVTTRSTSAEGMAADAPVGYFQSIAPVRISIRSHERLADLVAHTKFQMMSTMMYARPPYSYTTALRLLAHKHDLECARTLMQLWRTRTGPPTFIPLYNPVMQIDRTESRNQADHLEIEPLKLLTHYSPCTLFDLMCVPQVSPSGPLGVRFHYQDELVPDATMHDVAASMRRWAAQMPTARLDV